MTTDRDLRDMYKALSLLKADLTTTKREKALIEERWRAVAEQQREDDAQRTIQMQRLKETFLMREEEFQAQLWHLQRESAQRERELEMEKEVLGEELQRALQRRQGGDAGLDENQYSTESERDEDERPEMEDETQQKENEHDEEKGGESRVREKLGLLASLYALKVQVQEQTDQLMDQEACFAQERGEFMLQVDELRQQITELQVHLLEVNNEKQFMEEKFEFLKAEVDVIKQERDAFKQKCGELDAQQEEVTFATNELQSEVREARADDELDALLAKLDNISQENAVLRAKMDVITLENTTLLDAKLQLEGKLKTAVEQAQGYEAEIAALTSQIGTLKEQLVEADAMMALKLQGLRHTTCDEKKTLDDEWQARMSELQHTLDMRERELLEVTSEYAKLTAEAQALKQEIAEKEAQWNAERVGLLDAKTLLESELGHERERLLEHISRLNEAEARLATFDADMEYVKQDSAMKQATLENRVEKLVAERQELEDALSRTCSRVVELEREIASAASSHQELANQWTEARGKLERVVSRLSNENSMLLTTRVSVENELAKKTEQCTTLEQQVASLLEHGANCEVLQGQLDDMKQVAAAKEAELSMWRCQCEDMKAQLATALATTETTQGRVHELQSVCAAKEEDLVIARSRIRAIEQLVVTAQADVEQKAHEVDRLEQELVCLRQGIDAAGQQKQMAIARCVELETATDLALAQKDQEFIRLNDELTRLQASHTRAMALLIDEHQQASTAQHEEIAKAWQQLRTMEQQLMVQEDRLSGRGNTCEVGTEVWTWSKLCGSFDNLEDFLPQLQVFAARLQSTLLLCQENTTALDQLTRNSFNSEDYGVYEEMRHDATEMVRLTEEWKGVFDSEECASRVRLLRRHVLGILSRWYEWADLEVDNAPPPPFGIESHQVALILESWTQDEARRRYVQNWLTHAVSLHKEEEDGEGRLLEMSAMTRAVHDAFRMLIVPILRQNSSLHVRVFTRRVADVKASYSPEEPCWEMRIHVQVNSQRARQSSNRPPVATLVRASSTSSLSSVSSATSSTSSSSSKLRIIQERLERMRSMGDSQTVAP